jgi:hypothetical protein
VTISDAAPTSTRTAPIKYSRSGYWWCDKCKDFNSNSEEFCLLDDDCNNQKPFTSSKGGKRRTMKVKKYLKNNRKKTIRKNKKTIRKTIRKSKKTRKFKA